MALLNRNIDAAFRNYGFNHTDCQAFSKQMLVLTDRLEYLHRGLYLGFKALKQPSDPGFWTMWHTRGLQASIYRDTTPPVQVCRPANSCRWGDCWDGIRLRSDPVIRDTYC
jgi:hypothetical protein